MIRKRGVNYEDIFISPGCISEVIALSSYCPHLWKRENMIASRGKPDVNRFGTVISLLECLLAIGC